MRLGGYAVFDSHAGFRRGFLQANARVENLFTRDYEPPLGEVNFDDFMASMWMNQIKPLTGREGACRATLRQTSKPTNELSLIHDT